MQLEDVASASSGAKNVLELLAAVPVGQREHAAVCADCRAAAENIIETRALLAAVPSHAEMGGPWFATRVMAAISARGGEFARTADAWTFLPKLAARLTWASAVALLLASGWLYQRPAPTRQAAKSVLTDITGEPLVDNSTPANNDEVLVSLAEKPR
jgi:hypothetical protein